MDRQRYTWFRIAQLLVREIPEHARAERLALEDAAEALLLARSHDRDLDLTIDNASYALTRLTDTRAMVESEAVDLWEAICACGPAEHGADGLTGDQIDADDSDVAGPREQVFQGRGH